MTGYDMETERFLIGAMLYGEEYLNAIVAGVSVDDFTQKEHKRLFTLIVSMYNSNENVDMHSVYVKHSQEIKALGVSWTRLADCFCSMAGVESGIKKLSDETKARAILKTADDIKHSLEANTPISEVISMIENSMIKQTSLSERRYLSPQDMAMACLDTVGERMNKEIREKNVISTRFEKMNKALGGFELSELWALSGETGTGKSIFALNLACDIGVRQKRPTLYINSELSDKQMQMRIASHLSGISNTKIKTGETSDSEYGQLVKYLDPLHCGSLHTITMPDLQISNVIAEIRRFKRQNDIVFVLIDYIGRVDMTNSKNKDDWQMLKSAAQKLKTLAQDLNIVVVMVAQLSNNGKLAMASYMEHETDAHISIKKFDDDIMRKFEEKKEPWNIGIEIKKARSAPTGKILSMYFNGDKMTFTDNYQTACKYQWSAKRLGGS